MEAMQKQWNLIAQFLTVRLHLHPTLFLIYRINICDSLEVLKSILYVDDTRLFVEASKDLNVLLPKVNTDLQKLRNRCVKKY